MNSNLLMIDGLKILNFAPHSINLINRSCTHQGRNGECFLKKGFNVKEATAVYIPRGNYTLTVSEPAHCFNQEQEDQLNLFGPIGGSNFIGSIPSNQVEEADIIIVSSKCAELLLAALPYLQAGQQPGQVPFPFDVLQIDKFYVPKERVDSEIKPRVGSIGLQKVSGFYYLPFYVQMLSSGRTVSCVSLRQVCSSYCNQRAYNRAVMMQAPDPQMEQNLRLANQYLKDRGFSTYEEQAF